MNTINNATRKQIMAYLADVQGYSLEEYDDYSVQELRDMIKYSGNAAEFEGYTF